MQDAKVCKNEGFLSVFLEILEINLVIKNHKAQH